MLSTTILNVIAKINAIITANQAASDRDFTSDRKSVLKNAEETLYWSISLFCRKICSHAVIVAIAVSNLRRTQCDDWRISDKRKLRRRSGQSNDCLRRPSDKYVALFKRTVFIF